MIKLKVKVRFEGGISLLSCVCLAIAMLIREKMPRIAMPCYYRIIHCSEPPKYKSDKLINDSNNNRNVPTAVMSSFILG